MEKYRDHSLKAVSLDSGIKRTSRRIRNKEEGMPVEITTDSYRL